ncbi:MAG: phosphonate metabolism transcriptional regulator PhnF [Planctomycetota bacterium]|nr:MAG: phosphonate metabolism transcriptional regulator PhnF [Planctomycetota bacterium]
MYLQIARILENEIARAYRCGDMLPSEMTLAENFGVNRHTLRRAVDELVDAGVVERRRGHGTRVLDPAICYPISPRTRFTESINAQGHSAEVKLIFNRLAAATKGVAEALNLKDGSEVVWIEILRLADRNPFSVCSHFFPLPRFGGLIDVYKGGSLHSFLENEYGLLPKRKVSYISAIMPRTDDAHVLRTPRNRPLLRTKSINIDPLTERPVEYCVTRARSDRCQIEVHP